jgi:hypothetical protein
MVKLVHLAIIAIIIFVLTYDPKSGTLDKIIKDPEQNPNKKCCSDPNCVAKYPGQCKNVRYEAIQFAGDVPGGFTTSNATSLGGAILGP